MNPRSDTKTIISAMEYLSHDIYSNDGVANAAIAEAAERLRELLLENEVILKNQFKVQQDLEWWEETATIGAEINLNLHKEIKELKESNKELEEYTNKLLDNIPYLPKDMEVLREANLYFSLENYDFKRKIKKLKKKIKELEVGK